MLVLKFVFQSLFHLFYGWKGCNLLAISLNSFQQLFFLFH